MLVKVSGGFLFSAMLTELDEISLLAVYGLERFVFLEIVISTKIHLNSGDSQISPKLAY
jgi:hypothetical protein